MVNASINGEGLKGTNKRSFGVVIPVHNEAKMLTFTLPSICKLKPSEVIFVLDRCTDSTEKVIKRFWKRLNLNEIKLVLLKINQRSNWKIHLNFLYDFGIRQVGSEIILLSQADILHDCQKIREEIEKAQQGMISFSVSEHPHINPWNHLVTKILHTVGIFFGAQPFCGLIAFRKGTYLTCPLRSTDSLNFDTQMQLNFKKKGYPYVFISSKTVNLRPTLVFRGGRYKLWAVGKDRYEVGKSFWKVLFISFIRLTPEVIAGYLYSKSRHGKRQQS